MRGLHVEHRGSAVSWGVQCVGEYSGLGSTVGTTACGVMKAVK